MAELTAASASLDLEGKSPSELEQRRREIVLTLQRDYRGYDDPDIPTEMLHELVVITSTLRRKNAGPPRAKPSTGAAKTKPKATVDDLLL